MLRSRCSLMKLGHSAWPRILSSKLSTLESAKPFNDIPAPPGAWIPFIGNGSVMFKPHGFKKPEKNIVELKEKLLPPGATMMRAKFPIINPDGQGNLLFLFDPNDVQEVYRNEGKYPYRGQVFSAFKMLRSSRPDIFAENYGILIEEGEKWHEIRSRVQQDMMRPKSATFYLDKIQAISAEFVQYIRRKRNPENMQVDEFLMKSHLFAFESITAIALDTRLGCLNDELSPDLEKNLDATKVLIERFPELLFGIPWWKVLPRRWSKLYRTCEDNLQIVADFVKGKIDEAIKRVEKKKDQLADQTEISILEKMIIKNGPNSPITYVMAFDMVIAGIDTTGNTLSFLIYNLSRNPDKQEKLRQEIQRFGRSNLTVQDVGQMPYFKACLQESFRLTPTANSMGRVLPQETIIGGHKIPAGTMVLWFTKLMGQDRKQFEDPEKFIPERWIENKKEINPFAVRNFGHGPRMCVGKRFAELEIQVAVSKLLQNFHIEWAANYDMETITDLVNTPEKPLVFKFTDIKQ